MYNKDFDIDIVILWVDPTDAQWLAERDKYANVYGIEIDNKRYRDWGLLRYWFRSIENNAPWVRKIHFVTAGHFPHWLDTSNPKLNLIKHSDFIPAEYLPTFNSHTIELNIHRIPNLSERFIYFNDDLYILNPVKKTYFFRNGLPCDMPIQNVITTSPIGHVLLNNVNIINENFSKKKVIMNDFFLWFNYKYGKFLFRTILLSPWPNFTGFVDPHMANAYLKETFVEVWRKNFKKIDITCHSKFRQESDVNQYVMRYWQFCSAKFTPLNKDKTSIYYELDNELKEKDILINKSIKVVCINDGEVDDFEERKRILNKEFELKFPHKSTFEK